MELTRKDIADEKLTLLNMAIESAGIGTWVFDLVGDKKYFDSKASALLGFPTGIFNRSRREFLACVHPDDKREVKKQILDLIKKKPLIKSDFRVIWPDGTVKYLTAKSKTISDEKGKPKRLIGLIWDITDQKELQMTLQENILKTESIINNLNGAVFSCKFDKELTMEYISVGVEELTGYPMADFMMNKNRSFLSLILAEDRKRILKNIGDSLTERNSFTVEFRILSALNEIKWILGKGKGIFKGNRIIALEGLFSDISDRKKTEEELKSSLDQLHKVARHIDEVRENERVTISRELHDDLGQALTAVKIDLATIKQSVTDMATVLKINKTTALVSDTIKTVQRITSQLRPQIIDDLGLETAIEWYTKEFEQRNKIKIFLQMDYSLKIAPDPSLIVFRILQEALTNIARHSKATTVVITLLRNKDLIELSISDNGIGITDEMIHSKDSFGIINMAERAASLCGTFKIYRENNCFTVVNLVFPLFNKRTNENSDL